MIFLLDYKAPNNVATGVAYAIVIFYSWLLPWKHSTIVFGVFCSFLLIISYQIGAQSSVETNTAILNIVFSIIAIWSCTLVVLIGRKSLDSIEKAKVNLAKQVEIRTRDLKYSEQRLKESEQIYRNLYEHGNEMFFSLDAKNYSVIKCNETLTNWFGIEKDQILGQSISMLFDQNNADLIINNISNPEDASIELQLNIKNQQGDDRDVAFHFNSILTEFDSYYMCSLTDISQQIEDARKIQAQNEMLVNKNAELEQFAYVASHDLQEPLRTASSFIGLVLEKYSDGIDENGKAFLHRIVGANNRMKNLIQSILDYSRIGKNTQITEIDLNKIINEILMDFHSVISESDAEVNVHQLPKIKGSYNEIRILFQNLISNALKFKAKDRLVKIEISAEIQDHNFFIHIKDNGIGIEPQFKKQIFLIFQRLHTRDEYEGTGIGLAQVNKIAQFHEGSIKLETELGKGSTFSLQLPISRLVN